MVRVRCHRSIRLSLLLSVLASSVIVAEARGAKGKDEPPRPAIKSLAVKAGDEAAIAFQVSAPTDVEVAVLDAKGNVVRHLAAGVLGGKAAPPAPLRPGLSQTLTWDGKDDFGKPVPGSSYKVRVRAGSGVRFGRIIGGDAYTFGSISSVATDEDGNLYVMTSGGVLNQNQVSLRVFDSRGRYLREILPFPADLKPGAVTAVARLDPAANTLRPRNRTNLNPTFYPGGSALRLVSASKTGGITMTAGTNVYRMWLNGGNFAGPRSMWSKGAKLSNPKWNIPQLAVSPGGRYVYYSNVAGTRYKPKDHKDFDPRWPQGRVYRRDTEAGGDPEKFFDLALPAWEEKKHWLPDAWNKRTAAYGICTDARGHLYVCDLVNQAIIEVDPQGRQVSATPAPWPERIHVDQKSGDYYVITRLDRPKDGHVPKKLIKIAGRGSRAKITAQMPLKRGLGGASAFGT